MERVFGLPAADLAVVLGIIVALAIAALAVLAARNPVLLRMGLRNIPRRRGRAALIVLGLMLGTTIITSALLTGDTMAAAVRATANESLGPIDETIIGGSEAEAAVDIGLDAPRRYFAATAVVRTTDRLAEDLPIDGVAAAIIETVAAQHTDAGRTEPQVTLFAPDAERADDFGLPELADLEPGTVLLDDDAASELDAQAGDTITILAGEQLLDVTVAAVGDYRGTTTDGPAVLLPLAAAQ